MITTDDQAAETFRRRYMPRTVGMFERGGTVFRNGIATPPLCCPARAGFLTGQYPHNHGVFRNHPGYRDLVDPELVLPAWLQARGYRTGLVGEYLNRYVETYGNEPAPGYDRWFGVAKRAYLDYEVSVDGETRGYGSRPGDYQTTVLSREASRFAAESVEAGEPFFLWLTYLAPHDRRNKGGRCPDQTPQPRADADFYRSLGSPLPRDASFDEADVSDKPADVTQLPSIGPGDARLIELRWICTLATLAEVDRGIGRILDTLAAHGADDDTIVVFFSDNGAFYGEHRIRRGKVRPYDPAARVPFAVRVPAKFRRGADQPGEIAQPAGILDLAPTLLDYAQATPCLEGEPVAGETLCRRMDGRSLRGMLEGNRVNWPADRGLLMELRPKCFPYQAIRTRGYLYSRPTPGADATCPAIDELYDLRTDPLELDNIADDEMPGAAQTELNERLDSLARCSGIAGRDQPAGVPFCE